MHNDFVIMTDSGSDLPVRMLEELALESIPLSVLVEGEDPRPDYNVDRKDFYAKLRGGKMASTAAINLDQSLNAFEPHLAAGKDLLYIGFSSGLSSTCQSGRNAADELREKYPERKIYVVDSLAASLGQGLLVYHAVQKKRAGLSLEEIYEWLEQNKLHLCHWFTVDDLHFLQRGGRVSATTAIVGSMLQIKPIMHVDDEGHLTKVTTARGRRASIKALFDKCVETITQTPSDPFFISHGDCLEDAELLASMLREKYQGAEVVIDYVGAVIGAHSGPGTLALFYLGSKR